MKITQLIDYTENMDNYKYKIIIPGKAIYFDKRNVIKVSDNHSVFAVEFDKIQNLLLEIDKVWSDIEELKYVLGLREPYHINPNQEFKEGHRVASSVDGYAVYIKFKE